MARALERQPGRIVTRLYALQREREEKKNFEEQIRARDDDARLAEWFQPRISDKGRRSQSTARRHDVWNRRREERLATHRRDAVLAELSEVRDKPEVNPRSEVLAARQRERDGLSGYSHIEAMIERDRLMQLEKWERSQRLAAEEVPGTPRITALASRLQPTTDIFDRLYHAAAAQRQKKVAAAAAAGVDVSSSLGPPMEHSMMHSHHPDFTHSSINATPASASYGPVEGAAVAAAAARHTPVIAAAAVQRFAADGGLLERQEEHMRRREERLQRIREEERRRHTPEINRMSENIAAALPEGTTERLLRPRQSQHAASLAAPGFSGSSGAPFARPNHSAASHPAWQDGPAALGAPSHPSHGVASASSSAAAFNATVAPVNELAVYERAMVAEQRRQQRLQQARDELQKRRMAEYTFAPVTNSSGGAALANAPSTSVQSSRGAAADSQNAAVLGSSAHMSDDSPMARLVRRNEEWARKRDERLAALREEEARAAEETHPFAPVEAQRFRQQQQQDLHQQQEANRLYGGDGKPWGTNEFIARQRDARREREERLAALPVSLGGVDLTMPPPPRGPPLTTTMPKAAPHFTHRVNVLSLAPPVERAALHPDDDEAFL
jgi:hypothetical protein